MAFFIRRKNSGLQARKRDVPEGLWLKCPSCNEIIFKREVEQLFGLCPKCGHHFPLNRDERLRLLLEPDSFQEWDADLSSKDMLGFTGKAAYQVKLDAAMKKTGYKDAISIGQGQMGPITLGFGVMDFEFLGASMGSVVGEKVTRLFERSTAAGWPVVLVCASGGARMYEGLFSLLQMAKTSAAVARHFQAALAYIPVLTHPTTAGVMASFASLGDVIIAEPGALIGFAGPRVIKETTQQDLPEGFQRSEFLLKHGLLDLVVPRSELKGILVKLMSFMQ